MATVATRGTDNDKGNDKGKGKGKGTARTAAKGTEAYAHTHTSGDRPADEGAQWPELSDDLSPGDQGQEQYGEQEQGQDQGQDQGQPTPRRVMVPRDMTRSAYLEPAELKQLHPKLKLWPLEDARGRSMCWRLGEQTASEFIAGGLMGATRVLFHTPHIKVFFPVSGLYFAVRKVELRERQATVRAILRAVESVARQAAAFHLARDLGWNHSTTVDVQEQLRDVVVCRLLCKRAGGANHVYVR